MRTSADIRNDIRMDIRRVISCNRTQLPMPPSGPRRPSAHIRLQSPCPDFPEFWKTIPALEDSTDSQYS